MRPWAGTPSRGQRSARAAQLEKEKPGAKTAETTQNSMKNHEMAQLAEMLVSLHADLDVQHAVTITRDMAADVASPLGGRNEPTEIATKLMKSLRSSTGGHVRWPNLKYGQNTHP